MEMPFITDQKSVRSNLLKYFAKLVLGSRVNIRKNK